MSTHEYFEFQAIDWPFGEKQINELRRYSSRAIITPTSFLNEYHFGSFKGDALQWMEKYFDGHLYFASWGTRELYLRFPMSTVDVGLLEQFCREGVFQLIRSGSHIILRFALEECDSHWSSECGTLRDFLELRSSLLEEEDYRFCYLGWLLSLQHGYVGADELEPPVPFGLKSLSRSLQLLVGLFALDENLIEVAAQNSTEEPLEICDDALESCVAGLGSGEQFYWLSRLAGGHDPNLGAQFRRTLLPDSGIELFCDVEPRKAGELMAALG